MAKREKAVIERNEDIDEGEFLDDLSSLLGDDKQIETISALDMKAVDPSKMISTNLLPLDLTLGGGICRGRLYEISGPESNGKSTLCDSIVAAWLNHDPKALCLRIESESTMDKIRCEMIGIDLKRVFVFETLVLEEGYDQIQKFQEKVYSRYGESVPLLIVWDTLTAAAPKNEVDGDAMSGGMMEAPRINSREMRKLNFRCAEYNHSAIIIQQVREAGKDRYGNQQYSTTGGQAIKHYFSARISVKRREPIFSEKKADEVVGYVVELKMLKNKLTGSVSSVPCEMYLISGFSPIASMARFATEDGQAKPFINAAGAWVNAFDENGEVYGKYNGVKKFIAALGEDPYLQKLIEYAAYYNKAQEHEIYQIKYSKKIDTLREELNAIKAEKEKKAKETKAEISEEENKQLDDMLSNALGE